MSTETCQSRSPFFFFLQLFYFWHKCYSHFLTSKISHLSLCEIVWKMSLFFFTTNFYILFFLNSNHPHSLCILMVEADQAEAYSQIPSKKCFQFRIIELLREDYERRPVRTDTEWNTRTHTDVDSKHTLVQCLDLTLGIDAVWSILLDSLTSHMLAAVKTMPLALTLEVFLFLCVNLESSQKIFEFERGV